MRFTCKKLLILFIATLSLNTLANELNHKVFNPGSNSLFPVTSNIFYGDKEVILIDVQFQKNDALTLANNIKATGKTLTTIFISHGDPDYYFGLDVFQAAFPKAKILATPLTVAKIKKTMNGKLAYWGPILKDNAPQTLILPDVFNGDHLIVDDHLIEIKGLAHDPVHTYLWVPSLEIVAGGAVVFDDMHVWMADNKTLKSRETWLKTLSDITELKPKMVIPGHFLTGTLKDQSSVDFMVNYLTHFNAAVKQSVTSKDLINSMNKLYPRLGAKNILTLGAKVVMGEVVWN